MASITTVRAAIATALDAIDGLQTYARAPGDIVVPCAVVLPASPAVEFDSTMARGSDDLFFTIDLLVGNPDDPVAQSNLDGYLDGSGATSVKAAVDGNLAGAVSFARVARVLNYGEVEYAGLPYLGAKFFVEVCT